MPEGLVRRQWLTLDSRISVEGAQWGRAGPQAAGQGNAMQSPGDQLLHPMRPQQSVLLLLLGNPAWTERAHSLVRDWAEEAFPHALLPSEVTYQPDQIY